MIPADDMKFYIDPVQDMTLKAERVYVTEMAFPRPNNPFVGKVVEVKPYTERSSGDYWWVTVDGGNFVHGAPISHNSQHYTAHVGLLDDGKFVVGELFGNNGGYGYLNNCRTSDGRVRPGNHSSYRVKAWMKAAPWALELMPEPGDTTDVVAAKVELAKEKYKRREAMRVIVTESMERSWNKDLEELREDHEIPKPTFGAYVDGYVMVTLGEQREVRVADLSDDEQAKIAQLTGSASAVGRLDQRALVPVKFMATLAEDEHSSFTSVSGGAITAQARAKFNDYSLNMGQYNLLPVLRTLSV